jgi:hypothetical protein
MPFCQVSSGFNKTWSPGTSRMAAWRRHGPHTTWNTGPTVSPADTGPLTVNSSLQRGQVGGISGCDSISRISEVSSRANITGVSLFSDTLNSCEKNPLSACWKQNCPNTRKIIVRPRPAQRFEEDLSERQKRVKTESPSQRARAWSDYHTFTCLCCKAWGPDGGQTWYSVTVMSFPPDYSECNLQAEWVCAIKFLL